MKRYFFSISFIFLVNFVSAQTNIFAKINGFGINPLNDLNKSLYTKGVFDSSNTVTFEPGIQFGFEYFFVKRTAVKTILAFNKDQIGQKSGFVQIMLVYKAVNTKYFSLHLGFGPIAHSRETWRTIAGYKYESYYFRTNAKELKFSWLSGEIEFNFRAGENTKFSLSINHLHPRALGIFAGFKYCFKRPKVSPVKCPNFN